MLTKYFYILCQQSDKSIEISILFCVVKKYINLNRVNNISFYNYKAIKIFKNYHKVHIKNFIINN